MMNHTIASDGNVENDISEEHELRLDSHNERRNLKEAPGSSTKRNDLSENHNQQGTWVHT